MANEIDRLMNLAADEFTAKDLDTLIAYNRKLMEAYTSGVRVKKSSEPVDLEKFGLKGAPTISKIRRLT
jgi:hypothetical protein